MPSSGRLMTDKSQYRLSRAETCGYIAIIVVCAWFLTGCVYWLSRDFDAGGAHSGALCDAIRACASHSTMVH